MKPNDSQFRFTRREFLETGGAATLASFLAASPARAAEDKNPWAYDVSAFERTDPKLIAYAEQRRFKVPRPEPSRLALAPDGRLWIAAGKYVCAVDETGGVLQEIPFSSPAQCVRPLLDGTVIVGLRDHLKVFNAQGARQAAWDSPGRKAWFTGIAVKGDSVWAADSGNRVVLRYDRSGKLQGRLGERNKERDIPGLILPSPFLDVELHPDGLLRVNNTGRHRVEAYTLEGELAQSWGRPGVGIEGFSGCCNPINLAVLPDGRIVTAEKGLPRVKVYGLHGEFECVVAGVESFPENLRACAGGDCTKGGLDVAADAQGRIFILDLAAGDVRVMAPKQAAS